jgi:hypothetical protein
MASNSLPSRWICRLASSARRTGCWRSRRALIGRLGYNRCWAAAIGVGCGSNRLLRPSWMNTLMWTATTRAQHRRDGLRFASDLTDAEWSRDRATAAAAVKGWPAAGLTDARDRQCNLLRAPRRHPMADVAAMLCTPADRLWLVRGVARRRRLANHRPPAGHARPRAGRA